MIRNLSGIQIKQKVSFWGELRDGTTKRRVFLDDRGRKEESEGIGWKK